MLNTLQQKLFGQSRRARYALLLSFMQAVIISALEAIVFTMHRKTVDMIYLAVQDHSKDGYEEKIFRNAKSISVYHIIFIVAQLFQLVLIIDALYHENTIQLIALTIFNLGTLTYSVIQIYQSYTLLDTPAGILLSSRNPGLAKAPEIPYGVAIIAMMAIFAFVFTYLAYKLYQEFGWSIYKRIGADLSMRDRYKMYQIFIMLLKFDIFFFLGFTIQVLVIVLIQEDGHVVEHITFSTVGSIVMIVLGFWGVQTERKIPIYLFMLGCLGTLGYIVSKLIDVATNPSKYLGTRIFITFFLSVCFILGVATFIIAGLCLKNFDKGLKFHLSRRNVASETDDDQSTHEPGYSLDNVNNRVTKRWSID